MNFLEERIIKDGVVKEGNVLKVDSFLNHQMDVELLDRIGEEFHRRFAGKTVTKVLTIEASGIGIAYAVARCFGVPMVFAKKAKSINIDGDMYRAEVESFTHKNKNAVPPKSNTPAFSPASSFWRRTATKALPKLPPSAASANVISVGCFKNTAANRPCSSDSIAASKNPSSSCSPMKISRSPRSHKPSIFPTFTTSARPLRSSVGFPPPPSFAPNAKSLPQTVRKAKNPIDKFRQKEYNKRNIFKEADL